MDMEVKFDDKGNSTVHIHGDPYPSVEAIQYNRQGPPKVLATSVQHSLGGPAVNLRKNAPRRDETFINGRSTDDAADKAANQLGDLKHLLCREIPTSPMCLQKK
jgi:hypothetical protein